MASNHEQVFTNPRSANSTRPRHHKLKSTSQDHSARTPRNSKTPRIPGRNETSKPHGVACWVWETLETFSSYHCREAFGSWGVLKAKDGPEEMTCALQTWHRRNDVGAADGLGSPGSIACVVTSCRTYFSDTFCREYRSNHIYIYIYIYIYQHMYAYTDLRYMLIF